MNYLDYYQLEQEPFSIMPVTKFYYHSEQHDRAMEKLMHAIHGMKGLAVLVGEIGLGKTMLARRVLENLPDEEFEVSLLVVLHEDINSLWLLKRIAAQVGVTDLPDNKGEIISKLCNRLAELAEAGKKTVVLIDEAQMLRTRELMEEIRGLLNIELDDKKLISLVLFGLPELHECLKIDPALAQRIAIRVNLTPLSQIAAAEYIRFRLNQSGAQQRIFSDESIIKIHEYSGGIPRLINVLCDNTLLEGYIRKAPLPLPPDIVTSVAEDLGLPQPQQNPS